MNSDHRENIGTHPAFSSDPEIRLRARLDAATRKRAEAETNYTTARNNLRVFLDTQPEVCYSVQFPGDTCMWATGLVPGGTAPEEAAWDYADHHFNPRPGRFTFDDVMYRGARIVSE